MTTIFWNGKEYELDYVSPDDHETVLRGENDEIVISLNKLISQVERLMVENGATTRGWDDENWTVEYPDSIMKEVMNEMLEEYVVDELEAGNFKIIPYE